MKISGKTRICALIGDPVEHTMSPVMHNVAFDKLGLEYKKTEANFIFINLKRSADVVFMNMMKERVIIRPLTSFGLPECIRVSIGTKEQNKRFVAALKKVLS